MYTWRQSFTFLLHSKSTGRAKFFLKLTVRTFLKIGPKKKDFLEIGAFIYWSMCDVTYGEEIMNFQSLIHLSKFLQI